MCAGNAGRQEHHAREEAKRRQAQADAEARRRQEEMNRLAAQRQAAAAAQQAQLVAMQKQQAETEAAQKQQVAQLQAEQAERIGGIRARGNAVTQSLQILAQQGQAQAPTASMAPRKQGARGARSTTAALRMGATGSGSGSGSNLPV